MIIKVCGMKYAENIRALDKLKPDMTGFIFHPSSPRFADAVPEYMPSSSLRVGVFVNSETDYILYKVREFGLNLVQLAYGGSGKTFDWTLTQSYHGKTPFLLSGGIRPESLEQISSFRHPSFSGIDINSSFETAPGMKDTEVIGEFIKQLRTL